MDTNADRKLLALGMKSLKFTGKELIQLIQKFLEQSKNNELDDITMPYSQFQESDGASLLNLSPTDKDWEKFEELARQNQVNHTLKHDREHDKYYLCLQGDEKAIMTVLSDYIKQTKDVRQHNKSISSELERAKNQSQQKSAQQTKSELSREQGR